MDGLEKRVVVKEENIKGIKGTEEPYYSPSQRDKSEVALVSLSLLGASMCVSMDELPSKIFGGVCIAAGVGGLMLEYQVHPINFIKDIRKLTCSLVHYSYDKLKKHM